MQPGFSFARHLSAIGRGCFVLLLCVPVLVLPEPEDLYPIPHAGPWRWRQCLEDGYKVSERRMPKPAWGADGTVAKKIAFGTCSDGWTAQELPSMIARILTEEVLGIHAEYKYIADSLPMYLGMAGCASYSDWWCDEASYDQLNPAVHVSLAAWFADQTDSLVDYLTPEQFSESERHIKIIGSVGFQFKDTDYLMKEVLDEALAHHEWLDLTWGPRLKDGARFFTPLANINTSGGVYQSCSDEMDYKDHLIEKGYLCNSSAERDPWRRPTLDSSGNEVWDPAGSAPTRIIPWRSCSHNSPDYTFSPMPGWACIEDGYWASPTCQRLGNMTQNCIVYADYGTGYAWARNVIKTWERLEIPILYVYSGPWYTHGEIFTDFYVNGNRILFNWWTPDVSPELEWAHAAKTVGARSPIPRQIVYPPGEGSNGRFSTKVIRKELEVASKELIYMLERFEITDTDAQNLNADLAKYVVDKNLTTIEAQEEAYFNISCEWVKRNRDIADVAGAAPWSSWLMAGKKCPQGTTWNKIGASCEECPQGKTADLGAECFDCAAGTFCSREGTQVPVVCPKGKFCEVGSIFPTDCPVGTMNPIEGGQNESSCLPCEAGTFGADHGADHCLSCDEGHYQNLSGQSLCSRCPRGTFAAEPGLPACRVCPQDTTTEEAGCTSRDSCVCPPGAYRATSSGRCIECGAGTQCRGFGAEPQALEGFLLAEAKEDGLSVFQCFQDRRRCPGGLVGTCSDGRQGIACATCKPQMRPGGDGACEQCDGSDKGLFAIAVVLFFLTLGAIYIKVSVVDAERIGQTLMLIVLTGAQVVSIAQLLGVFDKLWVLWKPPFSTLIAVFRVLNLDIQVLRMNCIGGFSALATYALTMLVAPIAITTIAVMHLFRVLLFLGRPDAHRFRAALGTGGLLLMGFFITITSSILSPFQCQLHPNKMWTMLQYDAQLCWQDRDHMRMMVIGSLGLSIPIGFLCLVAHLLHVFPSKMSTGDVHFLNTYAFLFLRVKPQTRWFLLVYLLRNLVIAIIPAIPNPFWQVISIQFMFALTLVSIAYFQPWRLDIANFLEVILSLFLLLLMCLASFFIERADVDGISHLCFVAALMCFVACPTALLAVLIRRLLRGKAFHFFLCHHKSAAGSFARLLKMVLLEQRGIKGGVFIDSDNLADLDQLFSYVAQDVDTLAVLATSEIFLRPWCLGEVATAHICKTTIYPIYFPDFHMPEQDYIDNIDARVDITVLTESGIGVRNVRRALMSFADQDFAEVPLQLQLLGMSMLAKQMVMKSIGGVLHVSSNTSLTSSSFGGRVPSQFSETQAILADAMNTEAVAAAIILTMLLRPLTGGRLQDLPALYDDLPCKAGQEECLPTAVTVVILMCTGGCFTQGHFLQGLVWAMNAGVCKVLPISVADSFQFPTEVFYRNLGESTARLCQQAGAEVVPELLRKYVEAIFRKIALPFSPVSSSQVLEGQASMIWGRLRNITKSSGADSVEPDRLPSTHLQASRIIIAAPALEDLSALTCSMVRQTSASASMAPVASAVSVGSALSALTMVSDSWDPYSFGV